MRFVGVTSAHLQLPVFGKERTLLLSVKPCPRPVAWTTMFQTLFIYERCTERSLLPFSRFVVVCNCFVYVLNLTSDGSGVPNSPKRGLPVSRNAFQDSVSTKLQRKSSRLVSIKWQTKLAGAANSAHQQRERTGSQR